MQIYLLFSFVTHSKLLAVPITRFPLDARADFRRSRPVSGCRGDHTETTDIEFDPQQTSYEAMLNIFWRNHDCTSRCSRQASNIGQELLWSPGGAGKGRLFVCV